MSATLIITLVVFIIAAVIILKVVKKVVKAIFMIAGLALILLLIAGFVVVADIKDFKDNFQSSPNLFLLQREDTINAGFSTTLMQQESELIFINAEQLSRYDQYFKEKNLKAVQGDYYKIFFVDERTFDQVETVNLGDDRIFAKKELFDLIDSQTPIDDYIEKQHPGLSEQEKNIAKSQLMSENNIQDDAEFKGILFAFIFNSVAEKQGSLFLFEHLKQGNIKVYPLTSAFRIIKSLPKFLYEKAIQIQGE